MPRAAQRQAQVAEVNVLDVRRGECSVLPPYALPEGYAAAIINYRLDKVDTLAGPVAVPVTRPGLTRVTSAVSPDAFPFLALGRSANYQVAATKAHLYKIVAGVPTLVGTHEAGDDYRPVLINYGGLVIILDGSWPKYWDEASYNLLYDASGYELDFRAATASGTLSLYAGAVVEAGQVATTPAWTTGLTMPTGPIVVNLAKQGSPTGNVTLKVYDGSMTLVATSDALPAASLTTSGVDYEFVFSAAYLRARSTAYTYALAFSGGDASNYVKVAYAAVASGGGVKTKTGTTWTPDATKNLFIGVRPSLPPQARWGAVWNERLFLAGDPDNSGPAFDGSKVFYSDLPDEDDFGAHGPFNWGSGTLAGADAGYLGIDRGDGAAITGLCPGLGGLVVFKGPEPARVYHLTGTQPSDWTLATLPPRITAASGHACLPVANNVLFLSPEGLCDLAGVQEYGEVNYKPLSWPVADQFRGLVTAGAFMGAYGRDDQVWIQLAGSEYLHVYHVGLQAWSRYKLGSNADELTIDQLMLAIDDWDFTIEDGFRIIPASLAFDGVGFFIGGDDGHLYEVDQAVTFDGVVPTTYTLWGPATDLGLAHNLKQFKRLNVRLTTRGLLGATGKVAFRTNLAQGNLLTRSFNLPLDEATLIEDLELYINDWDWPISGATPSVPRSAVINFNARHVQAGLVDLGLLLEPLQVDGVFLRYAVLGVH